MISLCQMSISSDFVSVSCDPLPELFARRWHRRQVLGHLLAPLFSRHAEPDHLGHRQDHRRAAQRDQRDLEIFRHIAQHARHLLLRSVDALAHGREHRHRDTDIGVKAAADISRHRVAGQQADLAPHFVRNEKVKGAITSGRASPKLLRDQRKSPVRLSFQVPVAGS